MLVLIICPEFDIQSLAVLDSQRVINDTRSGTAQSVPDAASAVQRNSRMRGIGEGSIPAWGSDSDSDSPVLATNM